MSVPPFVPSKPMPCPRCSEWCCRLPSKVAPLVALKLMPSPGPVADVEPAIVQLAIASWPVTASEITWPEPPFIVKPEIESVAVPSKVNTPCPALLVASIVKRPAPGPWIVSESEISKTPLVRLIVWA